VGNTFDFSGASLRYVGYLIHFSFVLPLGHVSRCYLYYFSFSNSILSFIFYMNSYLLLTLTLSSCILQSIHLFTIIALSLQVYKVRSLTQGYTFQAVLASQVASLNSGTLSQLRVITNLLPWPQAMLNHDPR
jgi:hypothetical protein